MAIINIGILAHVDAGKTSLTERILFETGVIQTIGSVDKGTTQTDTMELERARGITIKSAVVSFNLDDLKVNLVDTPGHPDFVAEVDRALAVLDGVVLVISAVEGVQSQTRRLVHAIRSARLPAMIFINKIDRVGARERDLLEDIRAKLELRPIAMSTANGIGDRAATVTASDRRDPEWTGRLIDLLAETDANIIEEFDRTDGNLDDAWLEAVLRAQIASGEMAPAYFGSAITGAGVTALLDGIGRWFPVAPESLDESVEAIIFKISRRASGEKVVFARMTSGELNVRERVTLHRCHAAGDLFTVEGRITGIDRFEAGSIISVETARSGEIVGLHGLAEARIGDRIGANGHAQVASPAFPPPALESVIHPVDPSAVTQLRSALEQLAEQDPLISLRQRNEAGEISVRLYGEVQKEVISDTLSRDYGVAVSFGPSQTICIERPRQAGEHVEHIGEAGNPFFATLGFRIEPAESGTGIRYERELGALPLAFYRAIEETVHETLSQGLYGWDVPDCRVTLTARGLVPESTAADFRKLTPLILMNALHRAGTDVCEPIEELQIVIPEDTYGAVCGLLINGRATIRNTLPERGSLRIICDVPVAELRLIEQQLPGLTRGEGGWSSAFAGYIPIPGAAPSRDRVGPNPLNRAQYLAAVARM